MARSRSSSHLRCKQQIDDAAEETAQLQAEFEQEEADWAQQLEEATLLMPLGLAVLKPTTLTR